MNDLRHWLTLCEAAPHEDRELAMMLAGEKPLALITQRQLPPFIPYIGNGTFVKDDIPFKKGRQYLIAHPAEAWRMPKMKAIYADVARRGFTDDDHRAIGQLLGYTEDQVNVFIKLEKHRRDEQQNDLRRWVTLIVEASRIYLTVYRGECTGNRGGFFWTEDRKFARQFTQSGQHHEILVRYLFPGDIFKQSADVYAGDEAGVDAALETAKQAGYKAILLSEGPGQPHSIYVFDRSALMRRPPT
jgi:hypothetical protein